MEPFWNKMASYLPMKFTPNMVSLTGSLFYVSAYLLIAYYDLSLAKPIPSYVYFYSSLMLFLYQTFDAIDGKHARSTNRTSAVGTFVDHGLDTLVNFIYPVTIAQSHLLGNSFIVLVFQISLQMGFYVYAMENYITGTMRTGGGTFVQFVIMFLTSFPGIFGFSIIKFKLFGLSPVSFIILLYVRFVTYSVA